GMILPLRWYMQILFDQAARGAPVANSAPAFGWLSGLALLYLGLACWRLTGITRRFAKGQSAMVGEEAVQVPNSRGIVLGEIKRILGDRSVLGFMVIAPMLYGVFYPQPYLGQTLRHIPIAVVDLDRTELSREFIMTLDADETVKVAVRAETLAEAQEQLFLRNVFGIIEIPP